jgi:hypothetical protein
MKYSVSYADNTGYHFEEGKSLLDVLILLVASEEENVTGLAIDLQKEEESGQSKEAGDEK